MFKINGLVLGLCPSPAMLGAVAAVFVQHCKQYKNDHINVTEKLFRLLYVDDLRTGEETVQDAYELYQLAEQVMPEGGFNLRKWNSNSIHLMKQITENEATLMGGEQDKQDCPGCNIAELR